MVKTFIEIKNRIIFFSVTFLSVFFITYSYKTFLLVLTLTSNPTFSNDILKYFIFTSISELFSNYITLTFFITRQILFYIFIYHSICFFSSGLYKIEYLYLKYIFFLSLSLNILSIFFFFSVLIPMLSFFFLSFQEYSLQSISFYFEAKISDYLMFFIELYSNCFFSFQCCILIILLSDFTTKNVKLLKVIRKYIYLLILILSTLTTPPDILSQLLLFNVLIVLLEIQIFYKILKKNCINLVN
jgi:Sec-independent protein secretion pathway component TatC